MNPIQLHLALNHFPVVGLFVALILLIAALLLKTAILRKAAYLIIIGIGILIPIIEWSGEESEEILEDHYEVSHDAIHTHEEAGERASLLFYLVAMTAVVGFGSEFYMFSIRTVIAGVVLVVGLITLGFSLNAAHSGGLIRHPELQAATISILSAYKPIHLT